MWTRTDVNRHRGMFAKIVEQPARFEFLSYLGLGYLEDRHCFNHPIVATDSIGMRRLMWHQSGGSLISNLRSEYEDGGCFSGNAK